MSKIQSHAHLPGFESEGVSRDQHGQVDVGGHFEAKTGANKAGIDQLDTAGNLLYIGEHMLKFLVTGRYLSRAHKALALAQQVQVIELPGYDAYHGLLENEERHLVNSIQDSMSGRYHR